MAQLHFAKGVKRVSLDNQADASMPIFLDDRHRVLEAPTLWIMGSVAKKRSRSNDTLKQYCSVMRRYLQWLDDNNYGSQQWAMVDEDIFSKYIESLCTGIDGKSIEYYCACIASFYTWARKKNYRHYFDLDSDGIKHKVQVVLKDQLMLAHVKSAITIKTLDFETPTGKKALHEQELEKFVTDRNHKVVLAAMDDMVYQIIASIMWVTGMRPRDLFQLPYRGKEQNIGFIPYDADEIPEALDQLEITYWFRSKGKHRSIQFPGILWRVICERYIPLRRERAHLHYNKHGISPSNATLFLAADGEVINADRLRYAFDKAVLKSRVLPPNAPGHGFTGTKYTPKMLRHSCATYFVYAHLKRNKLLGKTYQYDPAVDDKLRRMLGHSDIGTTYKYYVHLVNRFHSEDLLQDLKNSHVNQALNALLESMDY
jgi:integrase